MSTPGLSFEYLSGFSSPHWPPAVAGIRARVFPSDYHGKPDRIAYPEDYLLMARLDSSVVGFAFLDAGANPGVCSLRELAVAGPHQGLGFGEQLVREAARWLGPEFSLMYVQALEDEDYDRRVEWFELLGFRQENRFTAHCALLEDLVVSGSRSG